MMRSFIIYTSANRVIKIKGDELGGICSAYRDIKIHTKFWLGILKGRDHMEDLGLDPRIILKRVLGKIWFRAVDWIYVAGFCVADNKTSVSVKVVEFLG